eukprot:199555_1
MIGVSQTKLTATIITPALHRAVGHDSTRMIRSHPNLGRFDTCAEIDIIQIFTHLIRLGPDYIGMPLAQSPVGIQPPTFHPAIADNHAHMGIYRRDLSHVVGVSGANGTTDSSRVMNRVDLNMTSRDIQADIEFVRQIASLNLNGPSNGQSSSEELMAAFQIGAASQQVPGQLDAVNYSWQ